MTVTLELPPDIEATLLAKAEAEGKPVTDYIRDIVRQRIEPWLSNNGAETHGFAQEKEQRIRAFQSLLARNSERKVALTDEAMDRESIYGDHGA